MCKNTTFQDYQNNIITSFQDYQNSNYTFFQDYQNGNFTSFQDYQSNKFTSFQDYCGISPKKLQNWIDCVILQKMSAMPIQFVLVF